MTTAETVSVLAAGAAVVIVIALLVGLIALARTIRELRTLTAGLQEVVPLAAELRASLAETRSEIERLGGVTDRAENITATVDSASHLAYLAFSNPVIKSLAAGAGITRAWRVLRRNKG